MNRWKVRLSWLHFNSLLWRFLLIGIVSLSPLVGALIQFSGDEHEMVLKDRRLQAGLLISHAIERYRDTVEATRSMLRIVASAPDLREGDPACSALLNRYVTLPGGVSALTFSSPDGAVLCSSGDDRTRISSSVQSFSTSTPRSGRFVVSDLTIDGDAGELVFVGTMPVMSSGQAIGILSAKVHTHVFGGQDVKEAVASLDANALVVDRNGILLGHFPSRADLVGWNLRDHPLIQMILGASGKGEATDLSGKQRLFLFRPLPGTDAVLAVGLERESVAGSINQALVYRLVLIGLIIGGSFLLGALGADVLIFRPLRSLVRTAGDLAHGDFSARSRYGGTSEIGILAKTLNRLAEAVADRERALKAAKDTAEKALQEAKIANDAKTDFLASMSHEIRTPLNGIIGYTEQLLDENLNDRQRRCAELIQVSGAALLTIANDILDFSSIEAEQLELNHEPFSLRGLIQDTVSIVVSGAGKQSVPIKVVLDPEVPDRLCGDEARLRQVLLNLLNNAVKFTKEGTVTVRADYKGSCPEGEQLKISVIDTGIGIPSDKHDRLFKRFSQVDRSIRREFGGTGLGLAICKRLIELMGGRIGFESEEGGGSTFWIELALPHVADFQKRPVDDIPVTAVRPARILLAEDIEVNQELARALLVSMGHEVDIVPDGQAAVAAIKKRHYDLVLMDVQMPGVDGITATKRIRTLQTPVGQVPIIAMTANVLPQQVRSFREAGMNDHIGKPIRRSELLAKLDQWLPRDGSPLAYDDSNPVALAPDVNEREYEEFRKMMGPEQVGRWLDRLDDHLANGFEGDPAAPEDLERIVRHAHAVVSQAALLGFGRLADLCVQLEEACAKKEDVMPRLQEVRKIAVRARQAIAQMKTQSVS